MSQRKILVLLCEICLMLLGREDCEQGKEMEERGRKRKGVTERKKNQKNSFVKVYWHSCDG